MRNRLFIKYGLLSITILLLSLSSFSQSKKDNAYLIETIATPQGLNPQTGGIDFLPDGRLVACFMRGEVMTYNPKTEEWKLFAKGLQLPLGILAVNNSDVFVMQSSELTRLTDKDGDGQADAYESVTHNFGISGNYHEFNYGPVADHEGNLYFALNTASSGNGVRKKVRGVFNPLGRDGVDGHKEMFSVVPYRGWVMQLNPAGELRPYALGFRSPNGLGYSPDGHLFVTDNQSDWVPTSALYDVRKDHFYGHPASLIWKKDWGKRNPFDLPLSELKGMRTLPIVQFPHGIMANSPSEPIIDTTKGKFGPFAGQLFVGEMNHSRILRVMLEEVEGELQGACIPFIDGNGLRLGNNRLAFAPDGSLWIGQIDFGGWVGKSGIQRVSFTGHEPMDIYSMNLTSRGFDLTFTRPIDTSLAGEIDNYKMRRYRYEYRKKDIQEGIDDAPQVDLEDISITDIRISSDKKKVSLTLENLAPEFIYELKLKNIKAFDGQILGNDLVCYTLNKLLP